RTVVADASPAAVSMKPAPRAVAVRPEPAPEVERIDPQPVDSNVPGEPVEVAVARAADDETGVDSTPKRVLIKVASAPVIDMQDSEEWAREIEAQARMKKNTSHSGGVSLFSARF